MAPGRTQVRDRPGAEPWGVAPHHDQANWGLLGSSPLLSPPTQQPKGLKHAGTLTQAPTQLLGSLH